MKCTIKHTGDSIPEFLCRACHPELNASAPIRATADDASHDDAQAERYNRKQKRRLRAEVKTWRNRVDLMHKHNIDPRDIAKAEATLRKAEHDLYLIA